MQVNMVLSVELDQVSMELEKAGIVLQVLAFEEVPYCLGFTVGASVVRGCMAGASVW